jgi:hypothetical protein
LGTRPKRRNFVGSQQRHLGELLGRRVVIDVGVADEQRAARQDQHVHGVEILDAGLESDHRLDVAQVQRVLAEGAAQHGIGVVVAHQHGADQGGTPPHLALGVLDADALARHQSVVVLPEFLVARIGIRIDQFEMLAGANPQTVAGDALLHHLGAADQDRPRQSFVAHRLRGAQHALVLAFAENHARRLLLRRRKHRSHQEAGGIDEIVQLLA